MKRTTKIAAAGALLLAACGVKDPIFNTAHPDHGTVTLTTDWSGIGQGLTAPDSYTVAAALSSSTATAPEYTATLTGITNKLDHLFEPGAYRFLVHNTPERITLDGTLASAIAEAVTPSDRSTDFGTTPADAPVRFVHSNPGWLFTCALDARIERDSEPTLTAPMQQQVRQLTLLVEPRGAAADRIAGISATLSGVAGTLDWVSNTYGKPSEVPLSFTKIVSGADAGKWSATVCLLGIAGQEQTLLGWIRFNDETPAPIPLESDLSEALAQFNDDKPTPFTLDGIVAETPNQAGITATIDDWERATEETLVAE